MTRPPLKIDAPDLRLDADTVAEGVDWEQIFGSRGPVEIEIGIGKGRFLLTVAEARPEVRFLGVDWANQFLRIAETRALRRGLKNVRFVRIDARDLVCRAIPDRSVAAYYVFYPDPWPKKRHQKRRFLRPDTAVHLSRTLTEAGLLHVATDHDDYWSAIEPLFDGHDDFERLSRFGGEDFPVPVDGALTNFEAKYEVEGRSRHRGSWRRKATASESPPQPDPAGR